MLNLWLPLNGNLDNQGLSTATIVNSGATINTNGKIGSCYNFDGSNDYISIDCPDLYKVFSGGSQQFTIAFWIYHADTTRAIIFGDYGLSGAINFNLELTTDHRIRFYWAGSPDKNFASASAISLSNWTHIALTYDGNQVLIYKDGILQTDKYTGTLATKNKTSGVFYLGRDSRTGNTVLNGGLNDFRIYNRCLSYRECKSISAGLVVHYPLSMPGQDNLYIGSRTFTNTWTNASSWTTDSESYNGFVVKKKSTVWGGLAQNVSCTNGDIFTISFYAKVDLGGNILSIHRSSLGNVTTGLTILGGNFKSGTDWVTANDDGTEWKRYWATIQIASSDITYLQWRIENSVANKYLYVCGMKLEEGSIATPWTPNSADPEYAALGLNDGIEYDVSGYKNNGTKNGTITASSDTARYTTSSVFDGSSCIKNTNFNYASPSWTISIWYYLDVQPSAYQCIMCFSKGDGSDANKKIAICPNSTYIWFKEEGVSQNVPSALILNQWNHIAITCDESGSNIYVNGSRITGGNPSSFFTDCTDLVIGARASSAHAATTGVYYTGKLSDFRFYATKFTSEDILELYHTPITLSSNGTLLTQGEYVEV